MIRSLFFVLWFRAVGFCVLGLMCACVLRVLVVVVVVNRWVELI